MEFQDMNILFIVIFSVVILGGIAIFIVVIASIFSPKFQGKMMGKQIKATKYMIDETKDDIENIAATMGNVGINSKKKIYDENYDNLRDIATKKANIHKEEVEITTKAIKDGLSDNKMYCKHCGDLIDSDSEFCKHCGKRQ